MTDNDQKYASLIEFMKSKTNAPFLPSGQQFQMPNNLFNSEDTKIKLEKSDKSFHLYW